MMNAAGKLDAEGISTSKITWTMRGDDEIGLRAVVRQVSPAQYDQLLKNMLGSMGYEGTASHLEMGRPEDTTEPFQMSFDYKRDKGGDWPNLKVVAQLYPVVLPKPDKKEPPVEALQLGVPRVEMSKAAMTLPEGWGVELPEAVHEKSAWVSYDQTYRFEKGVMYSERRVEVFKDRVPVADWKTYDRFTEKINLGNEEYIQLVRHESGAKSEKTAPAAESEVEPAGAGGEEHEQNATRLLQEAFQALQSGDNLTAKTKADEVKSIKPTQPGLWTIYGYVELKHGEISAAILDYEKELKLHPSEVQVYPAEFAAQMGANRKSDAEATLGRWAEAAPEDSQPLVSLAALRYEDGRTAESVKTAERAIAIETKAGAAKESTELLLGRAQLKAGAKEEGHATLLALMKKTDNADMMNDAAYELANYGLELPLADRTTRTALDKLEEESRGWTLDESIRTLRGRTQMLEATWDTMGWVAFREGKLDVAEQYVRAAWLGRQDFEVGKHLGEIALARGDKNAALTDYELAIATVPQYDAMGVHKELSPDQKDLRQKADDLRKSGAKAETKDAKTALQKVRTIPLPWGGDGVAEYKLLVNGQGVVRMVPTSDKEVANAVAKVKQANLSLLMPAEANAQVALQGMVNCHQGKCELVLEP